MLVLLIIVIAVAVLAACTPSTFLFGLIDSTFSHGSSARQL